MSNRRYIPESLRSRYAFKLFALSAIIVLLVVGIGTGMALQVADQVTDEQLQTAEANAELEASELAQWFEGEQEAIRMLSAHEGIEPGDRDATRETLESERTQRSELASLHIVERGTQQSSNGTTEPIVVSTDRELEGQQLAASNVDWGEDTDGEEIEFAFDSEEDVLVSWVYLDDDEMAVAIASPTPDGEHVLIGEYHPSTRIEQATDVVDGTNTVVLGGVSAFVMFEEDSPDEFRRYKGDRESTEVGTKILERDDQFAPLSGSEMDDEEVRGYHHVPSDGVNWVVVKETPRSNALAVTDRVQSDLKGLIGIVFLGFVLLGGVIQYGPIRKIERLSEQANAIAEGNLNVDIEAGNRQDEFGQLSRSFENTQEYIETIARQAEKLSAQEFDAPVLDEQVPGQIGESIATMEQDLAKAFAELESERERYSTLITQSRDGIVVVRDKECVYTNARFLEITGYDSEEILGMSFESLFVPTDRKFAREVYSEAKNDSAKDVYRLGIATAEGEQRTVELVASRITHEGDSATLVNVRDVTERERREQRLEVYNRILRHNLRNNLQIVRAGLTGVEARKQSEQEMIAKAQENLNELLSTAEAARRIERSFTNLTIEEFDLGELFEQLERRANEEYPDGTVALPETAVTVEAASMLDEALWELLENALEHTGEQPHVDITVSVEEESAIIAISDSGTGLTRHTLQTIESGSETDLQHASGLGLLLAKWTVDASGGELSFDIEGETTVRVTLPLADVDNVHSSSYNRQSGTELV